METKAPIPLAVLVGIQTPDIPTTMATARSRLGTEAMVMSPAFDMSTASFMLTQPVTEKLAA